MRILFLSLALYGLSPFLTTAHGLAMNGLTYNLTTDHVQQLGAVSVTAPSPGTLRITAANGDLYDLQSAIGDELALDNLAQLLPFLDTRSGPGRLMLSFSIQADPIWEPADTGSGRKCTYLLGGPNLNTLKVVVSSYLFDSGLTISVQNFFAPTYEVISQVLPSDTANQTLQFSYPTGSLSLYFVATGQLFVFGQLQDNLSGTCFLDFDQYCTDRSLSSFNRVELFGTFAQALFGGGNLAFTCGDDPIYPPPMIGIFRNITSFTYDWRTLRAVWRDAHFGTIFNDGTADDSADPDSDGLPNLLEYATGTNPRVANATPTALQSALPSLALGFTRMRNTTDITYHVDVSNNLIDWTEIWTSANNPYWGGAAPSDQQAVLDTQPKSAATRRFLRLRVTAP